MLRGLRTRLGMAGRGSPQGSRRVHPTPPPPPPPLQVEEHPKEEEGENESSHCRSVNDFATADEVRQALVSCEYTHGSCLSGDDSTAWLFDKNDRILKELLQQTTTTTTTESDATGKGGETTEDNDNNTTDLSLLSLASHMMDWVPVTNYDAKTSHPVTLQQELRRLLVLKSFLILDNTTSSPQETFDEITQLARDTFHTAYCMISLVDLGRQWFLSKQGVDATQTPRNISFCTHGIQSQLDVFEVPNAKLDVRFCNNPLVNGPPYVQYYAGAPLISPEGYKLGMLCICDTKPRNPLSAEQRKTLQGMAAAAVQAMVSHRRTMSDWFRNLVVTHFPEYNDDDDKDDDDDSTEEEEEDRKEEDKGAVVVDESFDAFIKATNDLSLEGLIGMLKKQASEQQQLSWQPPRQHNKRRMIFPEISATSSPTKRYHYHDPRQKKKQVHFAPNVTLHNIESWKDQKDELWYSPDDMYDMRKSARRVTKHFRSCRPDYTAALLKVIQMDDPKDNNNSSSNNNNKNNNGKSNGEWMKRAKERAKERQLRKIMEANMIEENNARGLESRIVDVLKDHRTEARTAVMQEQWYHIKGRYNFSFFMDNLREQSLQHSQLGSRFAANLALVDQIEALRNSTKYSVAA